MSEKRLWDYIRDNISHVGHFDRIESTFTVNGRPDVNYCIDGSVGDIELKIYDPKRNGFVLRSSQNVWFKKRKKVGGRCWVLARYDYMPSRRPRFLLIEGSYTPALVHDRSYEGWLAVAHRTWDGSIDWGELVFILKG